MVGFYPFSRPKMPFILLLVPVNLTGKLQFWWTCSSQEYERVSLDYAKHSCVLHLIVTLQTKTVTSVYCTIDRPMGNRQFTASLFTHMKEIASKASVKHGWRVRFVRETSKKNFTILSVSSTIELKYKKIESCEQSTGLC